MKDKVQPLQSFLRIGAVVKLTGLPRSTVYDLVSRNQFPRPIKISERCSAWLETELCDWQAARIAQRDKSEAA